jgi:hypothetical protein
MNKHEKNIYNCEKKIKKMAQKMIWPPFLEVVPNGTTQGWI